MKISIIGGGNMGSSIAYGLATSDLISPSDITVINRSQKRTDEIISHNSTINSVTGDYNSLISADIIILAVKPWMIKEVLKAHFDKLNPKQLIASVASGITLQQLSNWTPVNTPVFRIMPNTAIAIKESMTFISSLYTNSEQDNLISSIFSKLGKVMIIEEKLQAATAALAGCGIAYAFRYIRAAMEGGVEMGIKATDAKQIVIQTLRGAADLLEANGTHPEEEIDKVTTPGGITIKGLNEMEHAGFTSAVIRGLKASNVE
jgi:pyrroline-5-carboxylate reductase